MSNTKKQLMTAIAMLVVAALALGTSTYAWFKANTEVIVESMTFSAQSVEDVQIALASHTATTNKWDGSLSANQTNTTASAFKTVILASDVLALYNGLDGGAATLTTGALKPASTINGSTFFTSKTTDSAWALDGVYKAKEFDSVTNVRQDCVRAIPLYIKSSSNTAIYFDKLKTTVTGSASPAVRIGFKPQDGSTIIWEVDKDGTIANRMDTTFGSADGLSTAIEAADGTIGTISGRVQALDGSTPIFTLTAGQPKFLMVYIWLEGCDYDCVSGISANDLTVNLAFTSKSN